MQLQLALRDTRIILEKWQKEIDEKSEEIEMLKENNNRNKIQIIYLLEQNRLLLNCNKTNLNRFKSLSAALDPSQQSNDLTEKEKLIKELEQYKNEIENIKQAQNQSMSLEDQKELFQNNKLLMKENETFKNKLSSYENRIIALTEQLSHTKIDTETKDQLDKIEKISKQLSLLPEIKTIYEAKMRGKDSIQQIACALDHLLKLIRVVFLFTIRQIIVRKELVIHNGNSKINKSNFEYLDFKYITCFNRIIYI